MTCRPPIHTMIEGSEEDSSQQQYDSSIKPIVVKETKSMKKKKTKVKQDADRRSPSVSQIQTQVQDEDECTEIDTSQQERDNSNIHKDAEENLTQAHNKNKYSEGDNSQQKHDNSSKKPKKTRNQNSSLRPVVTIEKNRNVNIRVEYWMAALSVAFMAVIVGCFFHVFKVKQISHNTSYTKSHTNLSKRYTSCRLEDLVNDYPQNEAAWQTLSIGIEIILNHERDTPAVYLFLHNNNSWISEVVSRIASQASECFGKESPVKLDSSDFTTRKIMNDYGHAIKMYKDKIEEGNVVLILDLDKIPAEAAGALHAICDTYNPIVKNVVILMTLNIHNSSVAGNAVETAELAFRELWSSKMKRSSLDPLITRLVDQVIALK